MGSGGWVRGAGTGVWPRPGSRYAAGAASGPQKGQEDDGEQGGGRQSKASVAGAARTARRPSVRCLVSVRAASAPGTAADGAETGNVHGAFRESGWEGANGETE